MENDGENMEIDEESVANFLTTNIITHDSMITCGNCKQQMMYQEYDSNHRNTHYNLCWLEGVENEIDFNNTSTVQEILRKTTSGCKTKLTFKCEWCDEVKLTTSGFANHLKKCKNNPMSSMNDTFMEHSQINMCASIINHNDDSMVTCGRCEEKMIYAEYKNIHKQKHYNLCWLNGDEKLDFLNEKKVVVLLRDFLPKNAERTRKICFICEWCENKSKSVLGYASHVKKCAIEQKFALPYPDEDHSFQSVDEDLISKHSSDSTVTCGRCNKSMLYEEYDKTHKSVHYNLCWLNGDEKPDFDDENVTQSLLKKSLPKHAARQKKVKFICEWCQVEKRSVIGFASHIKQCQSRPDKLGLRKTENDSNLKSDIEMAKERDESMVTCGRCNEKMTFKDYRINHCSKHYNLCWIDGEDKPDFENYDIVLAKLKQFVPFKVVRNRSVKLVCEDCKTVKKSIAGFSSHVIFCNKTDSDIKQLLIKCKDCGNKVKPASLMSHQTKNCKGFIKDNDNNDSCDHDNEKVLYYKMRRKRRPPNVLSFHPDTKYITEYYDCVCRLCNFITLNNKDINNHLLMVHGIDINNITNEKNLKDIVLNKYDMHRNFYVKPLLNYYNFFRKTFWKENFHRDFKCDIKVLNNNEALKYLPSLQQSCKIFISNDDQTYVDIFKSTHVNGMYWLFTGGPIWAMSWCPVPENVQVQYLAISCHPKPDMQHKEMNTYKYPSLVQLWTFNSLKNINYKSIIDMPYMSYGLAHEFGAVWDMAWCPSGSYEPENKIGLLALSTSCGDCPVFAMPTVDGNSDTFYIYKTKPVIARNFECEWIEEGVQCKKVCWQAVAPFRTLICGYSNGMVSVFNINLKSIFFNDDILYPSHNFKASRCSITGLSMNYYNSSILATTATDGNVILWDLKATENPVFQKKFYCPSDCTWLQQSYTLVHCSKGVNPLFSKVRTVNFSNFDDDVSGYNPDLYVSKDLGNTTKVISTHNVLNKVETLNGDDADETLNGENNENTTINDSSMISDDDSSKSSESNTNSYENKSYNAIKSGIDDEDLYGPSFFQRSTHWSVAGSNWMNVIATGDASGVIYEKLFLPEMNRLRKESSTILQLMLRKLSNDTVQSDYSNGHHFDDTVKEFGLESKFVTYDEIINNSRNDSKPLLRYPLNNITKVSWNQNFSSFRWLAIGTQSGFTLVSPSQTISEKSFESFYKIILTTDDDNNGVETINNQTDISM